MGASWQLLLLFHVPSSCDDARRWLPVREHHAVRHFQPSQRRDHGIAPGSSFCYCWTGNTASHYPVGEASLPSQSCMAPPPRSWPSGVAALSLMRRVLGSCRRLGRNHFLPRQSMCTEFGKQVIGRVGNFCYCSTCLRLVTMRGGGCPSARITLCDIFSRVRARIMA